MADSKVIQDIMDNLQDTSETLMKVATDVATQAEALAEHNTAPESHPYILQKIADLDSVSMADLNDAINTHATSTSAHANLVTQITNNVTQTAATNVTGAINTHNASNVAHPDMRSTINQLNTEMNVVRNYKTEIEKLGDLFSGGGSTISLPAIAGMETRITNSEATINTINTEITNLKPRVSSLETSQTHQDTRLNNLEIQVTDHTTKLVDLDIRVTELKNKLDSVGGSDPNMFDLVHTVPTYVKAGTTYNVSFSGITVPAGETLTFSIESPTAGISFSKTTGITQAETIVLSVASGIAAETQLQFILRGSLSPSGDNNGIIIVTRVAALPDMTNFTVSGIGATSVAGYAYDYNFTPATDPQGNAITYSIASCSSGTCTINSAARTGVFTPAVNATGGITVSIVFRATTVNGYVDKTITTVIASAINVSSLTSTHTNIAIPNTQIGFSLAGASSTAGGITYTVASKAGSILTFSPNVNISDGAPVTMNIPSNVVRGSTQTFVVTATDSVGASATKEFTIKMNALPVATNITATGLASNISSGTTSTVSFSGATDADNQTMTYSILNSSRPSVSFSKTSGIASGESISIAFDYVSANTTFTFDVRATDAMGEVSTDVKTFTTTIVPSYVAQAPTITYPAEGEVLSTDAVTFVFSELVVNTATGS